jgi:zinc protease
MVQLSRKNSARYLAAGVALIALAAGAVDARTASPQDAPASGTSAAATVKPSQPWAQAASDIPADANVRFGTLSNGMRYAIMKNATPPNQISLRLRIDAGSLMEKDDQLGLAHFMEHMAFNGTIHIPKNELITTLERLGLKFGADLNAATSFDQTFYQLDLPRNNDETVDTGLHVMREQVSEATMDADDIVGERGVIAGEERLRNSADLRVAMKSMDIFAQGQKLPTRFPIGDLKIINSAPRERFVDYYNTYYRPSRATIIAVGDFDVDAMEAKIRKEFGDWQPRAPDGPDPDLGTVAARGPETHVIFEPGASPAVSISWTNAPDLSPDTVSDRRKNMIKAFGFAVFKRRMGELSRTENPPFLSADGGVGDVMRSVGVAAVSASFVPGKWRRALEAIDQEQRRLVQYGISDTELQREIVQHRTVLQNAMKAASTRNTRALAVQLLMSVNDRNVYNSPQETLDEFEAAVKGLTAAQVNEPLKTVFTGNGPLVTLISPVPVEGGEAAVTAALQSSRQVAVAAPIAPVTRPWPYADFGKPGTVKERHELAGLGATVVSFANGVTLTVKPTTFSKGSIGINLLTGLGERNFSPDRVDPAIAMMSQLQAGGVGKLSLDDMGRTLNGRNYSVTFSMLGDRFMLGGGTRREDLPLEMQVLTAFLTDPAYRSTPFEALKLVYPTIYKTTLAQPSGAFTVNARELLAGGDKRTTVVSPETVATYSMDAERPKLRAMLSKGPIHITMVGDVSVDEAIAATARTFGALPPRPDAGQPTPGVEVRRFPAPTAEPLRFTHTGLAEQSLGYIAWPTTDLIGDKTEARRLEVLAAVLRLRALDEIREKEALAYSPSVASSYSDSYKGYGSISVQAQTAPDKLPAFFKAADGIVQSLRDQPITADELQRARGPLIEEAKRSRNSNGWWLSQLTYAVDRPSSVPQILTSIDIMEKMTPTDVQALARKYLRPELAWKVEVLPDKAAK